MQTLRLFALIIFTVTLAASVNAAELQKLTASDGARGDLFGSPAAIAGRTALIGNRNDDVNGGGSGSAYIFQDTSAAGDWSSITETKLTPSDGAAGDLFGSSAAIAGRTALIGAFNADDNFGSAYIICTALTPEQIGLISDEVAALATAGVLKKGQGNSLTSKLEAAQRQLDRGNVTPAINQLEDFIKKVNNLIRDGTLTEEQGGLLIDAAQNVLCR